MLILFFPLIFTLKWKLESVSSMQVTALISLSAHQSNSLVPVEVPLRPRHPHPASACFDKGQSRSTAPPSTHGCSGIKARNRWSSQPEELGSQPSLCGEGGEEESRLLRGHFHPPPSDFFPSQTKIGAETAVWLFSTSGIWRLECAWIGLAAF